MATEKTYNGDGSDTTFDITFPYLTHADIKVSVGGVTKTVDSDYTISGDTVTFTTAPATGTANVKLYRTTDIDNPEHEYSAGSSITAARLNENQRQALYAIEEAKLVTTTSGGITTGEKNDIHVNSDTDWVIRTDAVEKSMMADNSVGTDQIETNAVTAGEIAANAVGASELADNAVDTAAIANDAVNGTKIADDSIDSEHIAADSIDAEHYAPGSVDATALATDAVTQAKIADQTIDEARLQISNNPINGHTLTAQSGNTGGLTWATPNPAGSIIETFTLPCGGKSITVGSGTYTTQNVAAGQETTDDNWFDINGSSIGYTPPTGTQLVIYKFTYYECFVNYHTIGHCRFWIDSDEVTAARHSNAIHQVREGFRTFEWPIQIGGSADTAYGQQSTWTSSKTLKLQTRRYGSAQDYILHRTDTWDGTGYNASGGDIIVVPKLSITAIS